MVVAGEASRGEAGFGKVWQAWRGADRHGRQGKVRRVVVGHVGAMRGAVWQAS